MAAASLGGISCGDDGGGSDPDAAPDGGGGPTYRFPQGIASGDPRQSSVVLWTRVEAVDGSTDAIEVTAEVADSADFSNLVLQETMTVTADSDHTLRLVVTGLAAKTRYYYRFRAGTDASAEGRTLTAPEASDDTPVHFAWVSCQDYGAGFYGAYREMINDDEAREPAEQIQFVVHLGDFIYETRLDGFQGALDENFEPVMLTDRDGNERVVGEFPSGGGNAGGSNFADTVDDYRHLYKTFLADPDLQAARARWPFINVWDDHEFTNDAWQSQANFTDEQSLDEPSQTRKVAANQAWFEYVPAHLTGAPGVSGVEQDASDFAPASVTNTAWAADDVDATNLVTEQNNLDAIGSLTIYRSFRFGQHVELVMTDERSYRSDHAIPEELSAGGVLDGFFDPRNVLHANAVREFDAGMEGNGGDPLPEVDFLDNPRTTSPPGTMLGAEQKAWWKETMMGSDATWKLWGNEVPMMRFFVPDHGPLLIDRVMNADAWDGYNYERNELMQFLRDNNIENVVVITGDVHAHFAGLVMDDHDIVSPTPVVPEFIAAGIASNSLFSFFEDATRGASIPEAVRRIVTYDSTELGGSDAFVENLNVTVLNGPVAADAVAVTHDRADITANDDPTVNPHLKYADTNAQGYGLMTVTAAQVSATLVTIERPTSDNAEGAGIKRTASFTVQAGDPTTLTDPTITGTKPWPLV